MVYEAKQRSLNRKVALKVLSTGLGLTTKAILRFKREAEAAAKLHHTNIVPIYSTGEENRVPYYAMELVDGPSLDHVIRMLRQDRPNALGDGSCSRLYYISRRFASVDRHTDSSISCDSAVS